MNLTKLLTLTLLAALLPTGRALAGTNPSEDDAKDPVAGKVLETTNSRALTTLRSGELSPSG